MPLNSISPIDGRYEKYTKDLTPYFSESASMKYKIIAEGELASRIGLVCCTAENLPIKSEVADYFVSFAVLEHLPREKEAIREIRHLQSQQTKADQYPND